ncbi:zinc finger SWIM domain-containing protein 7-like [Patiria miniata]|uniref:SWIM-type domain-containing protein n=1 Tax=Patiria miniata TaxID=46514 RepID=A0A914AFG9_PATMI|nr:zinc finger SWIM domain-containing protein 7-like [Patiria miniata]
MEDILTLPEDLLSALHFVFKAPLLQALDLVDNKSVTKITCPAGRIAFQVLGSSGIPYICLPSSNFCSCQYYSFTVLKRNDVDLCKHVLAVLLSCAMEVCQEQQVSNDRMTQTLTPGHSEPEDEQPHHSRQT